MIGAIALALFSSLWRQVRAGVIESIQEQYLGVLGDENPLTLKQAYLVDRLHRPRNYIKTGTIGIKAPDVWGQNRMTRYRAEFEEQMRQRLGNFQVILQAAQRRSDVAVLTNANSELTGGDRGGGRQHPAPRPEASSGGDRGPPFGCGRPTVNSHGRGRDASARSIDDGQQRRWRGPHRARGRSVERRRPPEAPAPRAGASSSRPSASASDPTSALSDISAKLAALQNGLLPLPQNIANFATKAGQPGVGIEPTDSA